MAKEIKKICIMTIVATLLCQLGMALTCLPAGSVMHMPTIKNTILVGMVAFAMAFGLELLTGYLVDYGPHTAWWCSLATIFLLAVSILSFLNPVIANDGRIAYRYPTLAVMGFANLTMLLFSNRVKPSFKLPKFDWREPGNIFILLTSLLGVALCLLLPHETVIDYDDESHYKNTVTTSQGLYTVTDDADVRLFYWFWDHDLGFTPDARRQSDAELNEAQNNGNLYLESNIEAYDIRRTGYIAPAAGLWLGNALNLKASVKFTLGRIGNVLLYSLIMGLAIKKLKSGKMLLFVLGLCPYIIFAAACYSYDAWTQAFLSLGIALFFSILQSEDKVSNKELILMVGALMLGCMPKAPYIPIVMMPLLLPEDRFKTKKQRRRLLLAILAVLAFILIMTLITSFGAGDPIDERGNTDAFISGTAQLIYIASHPFAYAKTLFSFLFGGYLVSQQYLSGTGYLGYTGSYAIILAAMFVTAMTDNGGIPYKKPMIRISGIIVCLLAIMAAATTMYLIFTPVGADAIEGCQTRYMVFLLFPVFMFALNGWVKIENKQVYNVAIYAFSAVVLVYNIYELVIVPGLFH